MLTETKREDLKRRGEAAGYPIVSLDSGARHFEGEHGWTRLLEGNRVLSPHDELDIERQLGAAEQRQIAREAGRLPVNEPIDPNAPETPVERFERERLEETIRLAEYRRTPAGQAETQIELLTEIRDLLAKPR